MILVDASSLLTRVNAPTLGGSQDKRAFSILNAAGLKVAEYLNTSLPEKEYQTIYYTDALALPAKEKTYLAFSTEAGFLNTTVQPLAKSYASFKDALADTDFSKGKDLDFGIATAWERGRVLIYGMAANNNVVKLKYKAGFESEVEPLTGAQKVKDYTVVPDWLAEATLQTAVAIYQGIGEDQECLAIPKGAQILLEDHRRSNQDCYKPSL